MHPVNWPDLVTEWLAVTGLDADATVQVNSAADVPLSEALLRHLEITRITPGLLRFAADRARDPRELRKLLRPGNEGKLAQWSRGRQAVDVAAEFGVQAGPQEWADVLGRLQPRLFSVSSSPLADPRLVSLTVSVVRYQNPGGRPRQGVCSPFLADAEPGIPVPVRVRRTPHFRPPADPATPMVMVGPRHGHRALHRLSPGIPAPWPPRRELAVLRRTAPRDRLLLRARSWPPSWPTAR